MEIKRALTNLKLDPELQLPKRDLKKKFLFVFNRGYKGDTYRLLMQLALQPFAQKIVESHAFLSKSKTVNNFFKQYDPAKLSAYTKLRKEYGQDPHFRVSLPVMRMYLNDNAHPASVLAGFLDLDVIRKENPDAEAVITDMLTLPPLDNELTENLKNPTVVLNKFYQSQAILVNARVPTAAKMELSETFLGVRAETKSNFVIFYADFKISKEEAQQLSSTEWLQIRPIDLYPIILHWVMSVYGAKGRTMVSSFPISSIAKSLPEGHDKPENVRLDQYGLSLTPEGRPAYLPRTLDSTELFEDKYAQAGTNPDGSFSLLDQSVPVGMKPKLPVNIPVLMDWQNLKFSFSNTMGALTVLDLARFQRITPSHAAAILRQVIDSQAKLIEAMMHISAVSNTPTAISAYFKPEDGLAPTSDDVLSYAKKILASMAKAGDDIVFLGDIYKNEQFRPVARFLDRLWVDVQANLEAVYVKYSVAYITARLGYLGILTQYGSRIDEVELEDQTIRSAALNQGVQDGWVPPAIPLLSPKVGLIPHQKKVRNILKDDPDLAILPIQAGGGKSPLSIIDVLYQIKAGHNNPYLILCPGHLVPQYVKEIVFFTDGKLNAIPITTYVIRTSGYERLGKIMEAAPRNTVVVCDYDALRYRVANTVYGTSPTPVYPVIEFLRQFGFGYCLLDECHMVKNASSRTRATMMLIADIPKKRLASGTMAHDSATDLALQIAMLDPTLFGTREDFNNTYGEEIRGDKVYKWKPNSGTAIMAKIRSRVVVAGAMRKEWAALLPIPIEHIWQVELSPAQFAVYQAVLQETILIIKEEAKTNKNLAQFVNGPSVENKDESESEREAQGDSLEGLLKPYLARLEQFMTAPGRDPLGKAMLTGSDLVSPKIGEIERLIREHLASGIPGKVLIFTNYTAGAEEIFNNLPADLRASGVFYTAGEKVEKGAEFETDETKKWMVGVEFSMNTGLNFQHVSRLIRVDTVWNPGTLEQGNSRVNRPELKKVDRRENIYYDWVVANRTIDVTKISRLISKIVSVSKFENSEHGGYQALPDVPVIGMSLENVLGLNSWSEHLVEYAEAYRDYKTVLSEDYAEYRAKHGDISLEKVDVAETPKDAMLLKRVPYVPGLELYSAADLGLIRVDEYFRLEPDDEQDEDVDGPVVDKEEDEASDGEATDPLAVQILGMTVHTEFGDGVVTHVSKNLRRIKLRLPHNMEVRVRSSAAFLMNRKETSTKDIRNQILKSIGAMPIATPIDVEAPVVKPMKMTKKELRRIAREEEAKTDLKPTKQVTPQKKALIVNLEFTISNGFLSLSYMEDENDPNASKSIQALGFRPTAPFVYAEIANAQRLVKQFNVWEAAGFVLDPAVAVEVSTAFESMYDLLRTGSVAKHRAVYKFSQGNALVNFYREEAKPNNKPDVIKPYPMIEDGVAFIVLPIRGQTGTKAAIQHRAPGVKFKNSAPSLSYSCSTMNDALAMLRKITDAGVQIANLEDLKKQYTKIKKVTFRDVEKTVL